MREWRREGWEYSLSSMLVWEGYRCWNLESQKRLRLEAP
jgi:hypothetical protein